jgi:predicted dienelactone hydrolase
MYAKTLSESPGMNPDTSDTQAAPKQIAKATLLVHPSRRRLLRSTLALAAAYASSQFVMAAEAEPQDEVWLDTPRSREVPALVRWPAGKPQGVVIFSHGLGGRRTGADVWGTAWAQAGFTVVHLQHAGSDNVSLKGGFSALRKAMAPEQLLARVADVKFAIDEIARKHADSASPWAQVPVQKLAVAGHSFGARTVQALAGQAFPKAGGWSGLDKRVKAFIALSPALGRDVGQKQGLEDAKAMQRPMLVVSGSLDGEVLNNGETVASRRLVYDCLPLGAKALLWLDGADHLTFAGIDKQIPSNFLMRREKSTLDAEDAHHQRVVAVSTAWLKEQLLAQPMGQPAGLGKTDVWLRG